MKDLFNYNIDNNPAPKWTTNGYSKTTGAYVGTANPYIKDNTYIGEWIVIKLPYKIYLTKYQIWRSLTFWDGAPSLWRVYGSMDGINWVEITQASNTTVLTATSYDATWYYEKTLNPILQITYLYLGFVFNQIVKTSGTTTALSISELKIFGKDNIVVNTWTTTNSTNYNIYNTSYGNVGIGTNNPGTYKLYVNGSTCINGTLITNNKVDFTNGNTISVEGIIKFGGGGWHVNSYANIDFSTGGAKYSRMTLSCYNAKADGYHGGFYFTSGNGGTIGVNVLPDNNYSIKTDKACYFVANTVPSDRRIKTNIIDIDDYSALQQILLIEPKRYEYIDKITRGSNVVIGFIAQQVYEVIPEAINIISDIIPNIYKKATFNNSNINFIDDTDLSFIKINDSIKIQLNGENFYYKIQNINTNNIIVDNIIKNSHENIANSDNNECFVYGTEVHDFHAMNKDYIFTMNVCATQELYKLIQNQNIIIEELKNKIETLEARL